MHYVPLSQISDNPHQGDRDYSDVEELAGRIAAAYETSPSTYGLLQVPLGRLIKPAGFLELLPNEVELTAGHRVELAFGHRRLRAFMFLEGYDPGRYGAGVMPVHLQPLGEEQMLDAVWSENHERKDVSAVERAELLQKKLAQNGGSQRDVAEAWGLARSTVANELRLLKLPEFVQSAIRTGRLSGRQAQSLAGAVNLQELLGDEAKEKSWHRLQMYGEYAPDPATLITEVLDDPDRWPSGKIRKVTKQSMKRAGEVIPTGFSKLEIPTAETDEAPPEGHSALVLVSSKKKKATSWIRQPACRGCPRRLADYCFDEVCLTAKKAAYAYKMAQETAAELELPYSETAKHFFANQYDKMGQIVDIWEAGGCEHLVIGYSDDGYLVRPYDKNSDGTTSAHTGFKSKDPFQKGDKSLIVLGHVGDPADCHADNKKLVKATLKKQEQLYDKWKVPSREVRAKRSAQAAKDEKLLHKRVHRGFESFLLGQLPDEAGVTAALDGLMRLTSDEWRTGESDQVGLVRTLASWLFDKGRAIHSYSPVFTMRSARQIFQDLGIPLSLLDPDDDLETFKLDLIRPLDRYYDTYHGLEYGLEWRLPELLDVMDDARQAIDLRTAENLSLDEEAQELIQEVNDVCGLLDELADQMAADLAAEEEE